MSYLHLDNNDKLSKVRPYLDMLRDNCLDFAIWEKESSIDECMIPYYGRHSLKQFTRGKPIRFGYKVWCHNFRLGYLINFEVYQGAKGPCNTYKEEFGLGGGVLLSFLESVPTDKDENLIPEHTFADHFLC